MRADKTLPCLRFQYQPSLLDPEPILPLRRGAHAADRSNPSSNIRVVPAHMRWYRYAMLAWIESPARFPSFLFSAVERISLARNRKMRDASGEV